MADIITVRSPFGYISIDSSLLYSTFGTRYSLFGYERIGPIVITENLVIRESLSITIKEEDMQTPTQVHWGLSAGEYGKVIVLTLKDVDNVAIDVSSYTTISIIIRSPNDTKTISRAATFVTDGSNGQVQFTFSDGELDRGGEWEVQVELLKTGIKIKSEVFVLGVDPALI